MPVPAYLASLRVFCPLSEFPPGERRRWERYVAAGRAVGRAELMAGEHAQALAALVAPRLDVAEEHAVAEVVDGVTYLCPARTQLRTWQAAAAFRDGLPDLLADAFLPARLAAEASEQLAGWQEVSPQLQAHIRTSAWTVPLAWLLLFDPAERQVQPVALRYAAGLTTVRRRAGAALAILREALPAAPTAAALEELVHWLGGFSTRSRVELDYGALAELFEDLTAEVSVADLTEALAALAAGDGAAATAAYERVVSRWRPLQLRENAS